MKISIIVPCHVDNDVVRECLGKIVKQKNDHELIIPCDNFDFKYDNAKIIKSSKKLYANGIRNFGATHASGDYILFLDSDIIIEENFIKKLENYIIEFKPEILNFPTRDERSNNIFAKYKGYKESFQTDLLVNKNKTNKNIKIPFYGYAALFNKTIFQKLKGWPEMGEYSFIMEHEEFQKNIYASNIKMDFAENIKVDHYHHKNFSLFSNVFYRTGIWTTKKLRNEVEIDLFKSNKNAFLSFISILITILFLINYNWSIYLLIFFIVLDFDFIKNLFIKTKISFLLYLIIHIIYFNFIFLGAIKGFTEYYYKKITKKK